jgi:4-hydroxythreonine-4-phosphate dehydrogenase
MNKQPVKILISMGDPAGIGPELCLKVVAAGNLQSDTALTIVGSLAVLEHVASQTNIQLKAKRAAEPATQPGEAVIVDLDNMTPEKASKHVATMEGGQASIEYIEESVEYILQGKGDALVTAPINKQATALAGSSFPGHTEMLAELTDSEKPVMLLMNDHLKVVFATTHMALKDVALHLTPDSIFDKASVLNNALRDYFGISHPRIAICALNPHGSDGGRFGDEEERIVRPAIDRLQNEGYAASGPWPSDTLFSEAVKQNSPYDGVVAMYHDQGMIPIKLGGLSGVVNVTLNLPIIRTSPGHGTAYDIAGRGIADAGSMEKAIYVAHKMAMRF